MNSYRAIAEAEAAWWLAKAEEQQAKRQLFAEAGASKAELDAIDSQIRIAIGEAKWFATEYVQWQIETDARRERDRLAASSGAIP
jgi:hypothetical protein